MKLSQISECFALTLYLGHPHTISALNTKGFMQHQTEFTLHPIDRNKLKGYILNNSANVSSLVLGHPERGGRLFVPLSLYLPDFLSLTD